MELKADFENTHQQQQQLQQEAKLIQQQQQEQEAKVEEQQQQQQEQEAKVEEQQQQQQEQTFHVLAVDDSLIDRKLLEKLLRISSYQVTCVDSGDKALEYLGLLDNLDNDSTASSPKYSSHQEGSRVNLIMTDYCMPGMSGYDLLKRVKGSYWKDVPVVVMSSENEPSRISMCLEGGAEEFLLKPLQLSDLEKLQPHLLRSLDNSNQDNNINENDDNNNNNMDEINNFISSNNSSAFSKRKAYTAEAPERRPKMKELAVV